MADFDFSSWRQQVDTSAPPPPIIDPEQARENAIADNTRAEEAANDFLSTKQRTLFGGPDPYFAKQGKDAFLAAPATIDGLRQSRNRLVDGMANDAQRRRLAPMLDAQIGLARDDIARHAAEHYLQWQRQTAQNRIDGLTREAALLHPDTAMIGSLADAAAVVARAKGRVGEAPPDSDSEQAAVGAARSGVFNAAVQARLDAGNTAGASELYGRVKAQLAKEHAEPLRVQIKTAQSYDAAKKYAFDILPATPAASVDEADAQQQTATEKNQSDNADDPEFRTLAQHHINQTFNAQRQNLQQAAADTASTVENWVNALQSDGAPRTSLPAPALWNRLSPEQKDDLVDRLDRNGNGGLMAVQYQPVQDAEGSAGIAQAPSAGSNKRKPAQPAKSAQSLPPAVSAKRISGNEFDAAQQELYAALRTQRTAQWDAMLRAVLATPAPGAKVQLPLPDDWCGELVKIDPTYVDLTERAGKKYGIPPELLARLLYKESNYDRYANIDRRTLTPNTTKDRNRKKLPLPIGIAQMYPDALNSVGTTPEAYAKASAEDQINAGAAYLAQQYKALGDWPRAVAAYHSGLKAMDQWFSGGGPDYDSVQSRKLGYMDATGAIATSTASRVKIDIDRWRELKTELTHVFLGNAHRYDTR